MHIRSIIFRLIIVSHFPLLKAFFEKEIKVLLIFIPQRGNRQKYLQLLYELLLFPISFVFCPTFLASSIVERKLVCYRSRYISKQMYSLWLLNHKNAHFRLQLHWYTSFDWRVLRKSRKIFASDTMVTNGNDSLSG